MNGISKYDQPGHRLDVPDVAVESNERVAGIGGLFLCVCVCVCVCVCGWVGGCLNIQYSQTTHPASRHN